MNRKKGVVGIIACMVLCSVTTQATTYNKSVQYYNNPIFYYNGAQKSLDTSVIMIDGTTYVPVRSFSNAVGLDVDWQAGSNTLTVNGASQSNLSVQAELQAKDYEIASLKKELNSLQQQGIATTTGRTVTSTSTDYDQTEGTDILGTELTATAKDLAEEYEDYFEDIDFDFSVRLSSSRLKVTITYDRSSENKAFNKLSSRELKTFVEEVCEVVRDHHDEIAIEGTIKYTSTTKYYFDYSKKDRLTCGTDSNDTQYDEVTASDIVYLLRDLTTITIDDYNGSVTISKMEADVNESRERIKLNVYLELTEEMKKALNTNAGYDNDNDLKSYLKDFSRRINQETDYEDIQVYVYSGSNLVGYYDYEENELRIYNL